MTLTIWEWKIFIPLFFLQKFINYSTIIENIYSTNAKAWTKWNYKVKIFKGNEFVQQVVAQIPWRTNLILMVKLNDFESLVWYAYKTIERRDVWLEFKNTISVDLIDNMNLTRIQNPSKEDAVRIKKYKLAADWISDALPYTEAIPDCRLVEINGIAEIHPVISSDQFCDMFINFIESHGWFFGGGFNNITDEKQDY